MIRINCKQSPVIFLFLTFFCVMLDSAGQDSQADIAFSAQTQDVGKSGHVLRGVKVSVDSERRTDSNSFKKIMDKIPQDELARLKKMQRDNPEAFQKELGRYVRNQKNGVMSDEDRKISSLADKFRVTESQDERKRIRNEMIAILSSALDRRLEEALKQIESGQRRIDELRKAYDKRKANRDAVIEMRMNEIFKDPDLSW